MKKRLFTVITGIILFFSITQKTYAQHNDFQAGLYNVCFGSLIGGIGAVINKKPHEKFGKALLKGMGQGALGGYLVFEGKRLIGKFSKTGNYSYIWPSKLVNAMGNSIIENAASNRGFGKQWNLIIGFNRLEFHTKKKFKLKYRIMPNAFGYTVYKFTDGRFNFKESIKTGTLVFFTDKLKVSKGGEGYYASFTRVNTITLDKLIGEQNNTTLAHELIHTYQYESFLGLNSFFNKPLKKLAVSKKWAKFYTKIFYTDLNIMGSMYYLESFKKHGDRFFEKEAFYYTK